MSVSTGREDGLEQGYLDGRTGRRRNIRPTLVTALIFPSYASGYMAGYAKGYDAGQTDREAVRLDKVRERWIAAHERKKTSPQPENQTRRKDRENLLIARERQQPDHDRDR